MNKDILVCGVGGQGTVLASKLIAGAASTGGEVVHSAETIGMAQRGGSVTSHIRIGEKAFSPLIPSKKADLILSFEPSEAVRNLGYLKEGGLVIVNRITVKPITESLQDTGYDGTEMIDYLRKNCNTIVVDAYELCEKAGSSRCFNVAILGVACGAGVLGFSKEAMLAEIANRVAEKFIKQNELAFEAGYEVGCREGKE